MKKTYKTGDINVPKNVNLTELLHTSASDKPLHPSHLIARDSLSNRSLTIGELRDRAGRLAHGFKAKLNAQDRDRWAFIIPSSVDLIELFHAVLWAGGTGCPINHALKTVDISHALAISQPRFILAYTATVTVVEDAIKLATEELKRHDITWNPPIIVTAVGKRVDAYTHTSELLEDDPLPIPHYPDTTDRVASIHLSSGTTGSPKGVLLTHYNYVANCYQLHAHDAAQWHQHSRVVTFTPMVHIATTTIPLFFGPWTGMMHHVMPSYDLTEYIRVVNSVRPTSIHNAFSIMLPILNDPTVSSQFDFSHAELLVGTGTGTTPEMQQKILSRANWQTMNLYGMTEAAPYVAYQKVNNPVPLGSVGPLLPGIKAVLKIPGTATDVREGERGELWISGPNVAKRYVSISDSEVVNAKAFPMPGWYNTGDICTISTEGVLAVVGRTKELIKYKGFQVSPVELDGYLNRHPLVVEGATGSVWDESQMTELPTGYVVLAPKCRGKEVEALREIQRDVDGAVTGYKKLRGGVWEVKQMPKNPTMKVMRSELKKQITGHCSLEVGHKARL